VGHEGRSVHCLGNVKLRLPRHASGSQPSSNPGATILFRVNLLLNIMISFPFLFLGCSILHGMNSLMYVKDDKLIGSDGRMGHVLRKWHRYTVDRSFHNAIIWKELVFNDRITFLSFANHDALARRRIQVRGRFLLHRRRAAPSSGTAPHATGPDIALSILHDRRHGEGNTTLP